MNSGNIIRAPSNHNEQDLPKVAIGAGITLTGMLFGGAFQYIYHIVLAKFLGPRYLGLFVLGLTVVSISSALSKMGLDNGVLRYVSIYRGIGDKARVKGTVVRALQLTAIASLITGTVVFVSSNAIATAIFQQPDLAEIIAVLAVSIPFCTLTTLALAVCQAFYIAKYTALVQNIVRPSLNLCLVALFFVLGWKLAGAVAGYVMATFVALTLSLYLLRKTFPCVAKKTETTYETNKLLRYSLPLLIVSFLDYVILWTDTIMLGLFRTSAEVGIYSAAMKTSMLLIMFLVSFNFIFAPVISDLYNSQNLKKLEHIFKTVTRWAFTLSFPIFVSMVFWSEEIMHVFGPSFMLATTPLIILALGQMINLATGSVGNLLIMTGKTGLTVFNSLVALFINLVLNFILIPKYGMIGAACATAISLVTINLLRLFQVFLLMKMHPYDFSLIKPVLACLFSFVPIFLIPLKVFPQGIPELLVRFLAVMVLYTVILWLLGFKESDKELFRVLKTRLFHRLTHV
jgi:O-antigen/teichoic acid export membrane protein